MDGRNLFLNQNSSMPYWPDLIQFSIILTVAPNTSECTSTWAPTSSIYHFFLLFTYWVFHQFVVIGSLLVSRLSFIYLRKFCFVFIAWVCHGLWIRTSFANISSSILSSFSVRFECRFVFWESFHPTYHWTCSFLRIFASYYFVRPSVFLASFPI